jgi:hypothetical protein
MSMFLGTTSGTAGVGIQCYATDLRIRAKWAMLDYFDEQRTGRPWHSTFSYATPWWPKSACFGIGCEEWSSADSGYEDPELTSGAVAAMGFVGYSRDAYGTVLGGCTMKLFKTVDGGYPNTKDVKVYEVVSNTTTGFYSLYTPYHPDTHYIVSFKAGSPDVQGVTVNTLIGA